MSALGRELKLSDHIISFFCFLVLRQSVRSVALRPLGLQDLQLGIILAASRVYFEYQANALRA
jgi:hypothetical protein